MVTGSGACGRIAQRGPRTVAQMVEQQDYFSLLAYKVPINHQVCRSQVRVLFGALRKLTAIIGDKVYQLTWKSKKGYIYDKSSLKLLSEFAYPNVLGEGWGLTYDGKNLIASDGSKLLYFLDPNEPSKVIKYIAVAGSTQAYDQLNELEYHNGFIYANVWQKPIILKINPANGEVVGTFDFTEITRQNTKGSDDVLNGIAFKGENMLVTGKNWPKIYEVQIK